MDSARTNLDDLGRNSSYLILSITFIVLSLAGIFLFFQMRQPKPEVVSTPTPTPEFPTDIPTDIPVDIPTDTPLINQPTPTLTAKASPTVTPTLPPSASPTPTPLVLNFQSDTDKFSVVYQSSRQLYQDTESSGNRYTFYRSDSTITVHAGSSWSWSHPGRTFTSDLLVANQPTFRYDVTAQTIVDLQKDNLLYTIQCYHHAKESVKSECDSFLSSFKLL